MSKDKHFKMILADFNITSNSLHQRKCRQQCSFEDIYNQLIKDEALILHMQDLCANLEAIDISGAYDYVKNPLDSARSYMSTLYGQDLRIPIDKRAIDNSIKVKEYLEGKKRNSLS